MNVTLAEIVTFAVNEAFVETEVFVATEELVESEGLVESEELVEIETSGGWLVHEKDAQWRVKSPEPKNLNEIRPFRNVLGILSPSYI